MDRERIGVLVGDIEFYLNKLESLKIKNIKDMDDDKNLYSSSMLIFSAINRSLDLAEQIVNDKSLGSPTQYKEYFAVLGRKKIISNETSEKMQDLIRKRNKISHRYGDITKKEIFNSIDEVKIITKFIKEVKEGIK